MKTSASLDLRCRDNAVRGSLSSVLAPDNEGAPRGLSLSVEGRGRVLSLKVKSESPSTAVSTVLALLRDVSLFQEVWLLSHGTDTRATETDLR